MRLFHHFQLALEQIGVRLVSDRDKAALQAQLRGLSVLRGLQPHTGDAGQQGGIMSFCRKTVWLLIACAVLLPAGCAAQRGRMASKQQLRERPVQEKSLGKMTERRMASLEIIRWGLALNGMAKV